MQSPRNMKEHSVYWQEVDYTGSQVGVVEMKGVYKKWK